MLDTTLDERDNKVSPPNNKEFEVMATSKKHCSPSCNIIVCTKRDI